MKDTIKYILLNENGGPNLEELIGIAFSLSVSLAVYIVGHAWNRKEKEAYQSFEDIKSGIANPR